MVLPMLSFRSSTTHSLSFPNEVVGVRMVGVRFALGASAAVPVGDELSSKAVRERTPGEVPELIALNVAPTERPVGPDGARRMARPKKMTWLIIHSDSTQSTQYPVLRVVSTMGCPVSTLPGQH
jgi:hypothetical protein